MVRRIFFAALLFALLAVAVHTGALRSIDTYATDHLQPFAGGNGRPRIREATELLLIPASPPMSILLMAAIGALLYRSGRTAAAVIWPLVLVVGFAVELAAKLLIQQHDSTAWSGYGVSLDSSFPSGHMMRSILLAFAAGTLWPAGRPLFIVLSSAVAGVLLLNGWHTPTDIAGGVMIGLALSWSAILLEDRYGSRVSNWPPSARLGTVKSATDRRKS